MVVSSAAIHPAYHPSNSVLYTRIVDPYFMRKPGRTLYEDTMRMEALVQASALNWTIIRSAWLFESAAVTDYQLVENTAGGMYTGRADLAACLLAQLNDDRFVRKIAGSEHDRRYAQHDEADMARGHPETAEALGPFGWSIPRNVQPG